MKSKELEIGRCGEYFVIYTLIKQGFSAYLSDQGLNYDVVVDVDGVLLRGQVKSTLKPRTYGKSIDVYRFGTRVGRKGLSTAKITDCDFYAFVGIDKNKIAFFKTTELESDIKKGSVKQTIEMRTKDKEYPGRIYSNGTVRQKNWGMMIESYSSFQSMLNKRKDNQ